MRIVDRSGFSVRLTLWGKQAVEFSPSPKAVIAWKNVRVDGDEKKSAQAANNSQDAESLIVPSPKKE